MTNVNGRKGGMSILFLKQSTGEKKTTDVRDKVKDQAMNYQAENGSSIKRKELTLRRKNLQGRSSTNWLNTVVRWLLFSLNSLTA